MVTSHATRPHGVTAPRVWRSYRQLRQIAEKRLSEDGSGRILVRVLREADERRPMRLLDCAVNRLESPYGLERVRECIRRRN